MVCRSKEQNRQQTLKIQTHPFSKTNNKPTKLIPKICSQLTEGWCSMQQDSEKYIFPDNANSTRSWRLSPALPFLSLKQRFLTQVINVK